MEVSHLPDKEVKVMVLLMFTRLEGNKMMNSARTSKEIKSIIKKQRAEEYNKWNKKKIHLRESESVSSGNYQIRGKQCE